MPTTRWSIIFAMRDSISKHPQIRKFFELCIQVQDLPRHLGQHSGGHGGLPGAARFGGAAGAGDDAGRVVVQWDKEDCADLGIVKIDLLGLGMMAVLEDSLQIIRKHYGEEVDLGICRRTIGQIYETLQKADTVGMFQIESRAQMACLPRLKPKEFYDIVVQVAIIRPGPIVGKMVHPYLERRQGKRSRRRVCILRWSRCWSGRWACRCFRSSCCAWP